MDFGLVLASKVDEIGIVAHAENLGYSHAWITDSPMVRSEVHASLALAAQQTRTIRIGTGVAVPDLRIAPVMAQGIATIARLAPGRTFLGVGSGNSAWFAMGLRPPKVAAMAEYLRVVRGLLAGERVEFTLNGRKTLVEFLLKDYRFVDIRQKIPIYLSAFGPKVQALAGQYADGMILSMPRVARLEDAMANVRLGAERAGRPLDGFYTALFRSVVVLEPGEAANSQRIVLESGPSIMSRVHELYERLRKTGGEPPAYVRPIWKRFCALMAGVPDEVLHFKLHQGHSTFLPPEEAELITEGLVRATCLIGRPEELVERLRGLEREGIRQFMFQPPVEYQYRIVENFSRKVMSAM